VQCGPSRLMPANQLSTDRFLTFVRARKHFSEKYNPSKETFESALKEALLCLSQLGMSRELRSEQTRAISTLVSGKDLLAVLPTGFGKSLIFQLLVRVKEILTGKTSCVVVVRTLKCIVTVIKGDWKACTPPTSRLNKPCLRISVFRPILPLVFS